MSQNIELIIPQDWSDVSLNQYRNLLLLSLEYNKEEEKSILEYKLKQIHLFNPHVDYVDLLKLRLSQVELYFKEIQLLEDKEPIKEIVDKVVVDGVEYNLIDNHQLSLEQYIDAEKYSGLEKAHKLVAIFYISPDKYNDLLLNKLADWFDNEPSTKSFYLISRFFFIQKALELSMQLYSQQIKKQIQTRKELKEVMNKYGLRSSKRSLTAT